MRLFNGFILENLWVTGRLLYRCVSGDDCFSILKVLIEADANEGSGGGCECDASVDKVPMCRGEQLLIALLRMFDHRRAVVVAEDRKRTVLQLSCQ